MKNVSSTCFDSVVVEVKYFDAKNNHVDTITQPLYGVVASPSNEVAFRVRDEAAHAKEVYSSQVIRFVSAEPRKAPRTAAKAPSFQSSLGDFLVSWGPLLLLIGVWIFYMQRMKSKDSPQGKLVTLYEKQVEILETQNTTFDRIANALEARTSGSGNA
jgi:ATP-dependent Zn protease